MDKNIDIYLASCYLCDHKFLTIHQLAIHFTEKHPICRTCFSRYKDRDALSRHKCFLLAGNRQEASSSYTSTTLSNSSVVAGEWHANTDKSWPEYSGGHVQEHRWQHISSHPRQREATKVEDMVKFACSDCSVACKSSGRLENHQKGMKHGKYKAPQAPARKGDAEKVQRIANNISGDLKKCHHADCGSMYVLLSVHREVCTHKEPGIASNFNKPRYQTRSMTANSRQINMNTQTTEPKGAESSHSPSIGPDIILCKIPHCNKGFSEPIQLRRHEKSDHDDSSLLKYHTAKSHKLKCPHNHCHSHKTYWTKRSLVKHIKIHTDEGKKTAAKATREYRCLDCKVDFQSLYDLDRHIKSTVHFKPSTTPTVESVGAALNSCIPCNRKFKNSSALQMHMESSRHKPLTPGLTCIRPGCGRKFNSPSAMLHHVESGGCSPDMDRNFVNRMIVQNDPNGIITDHEAAAQADPEYGLGLSIPRAIANDSTARVGEIHVEDCDSETEADVIPTPTDTWGDDDSDDGDYGGVQILTPGTNTSGDSTPVANNNALIFTPQSGATSGIITPIGPRFTRSRIFPEYLQSRKLILLSAQQSGETHVACPLCVKRKKFTIPQLELHLMSAAHAPKIFHCPISILDAGKKDKHMRSFSTLSGLTQHVESEACKGGKVAFEKVVRFVEGKLRELGFENGFGLDLLQKGGFGGLIEA